MSSIIIPADHDRPSERESVLVIRGAREITMEWEWEVRNEGDGDGWADYWIQLQKEVGTREALWSKDKTWLEYHPGVGLKFEEGYLADRWQKEFAKLGGVEVYPKIPGGRLQVVQPGKTRKIVGRLTIPGPDFSARAYNFWSSLWYSQGYNPDPTFNLEIRLYMLSKKDAAFDSTQNAKLLGKHRWGKLWKVKDKVEPLTAAQRDQFLD